MLSYVTLACAVCITLAHDPNARPPPVKRGNPCAPLAIPNAMYEPPIAGYNSIADGGRVKVSCGAGYENHGASWVVCTKGRWITAAWEGTSTAPQCLASCEPPSIENAIFTPSVAGAGLTRHGTRVQVACAEGFEYVGDSTLTCYYGQWTGINEGRCYMANESFCRTPDMVPVINGIMSTYKEDPLQASKACNYYFLQMQGVKADGLSYLGINPATPQKPEDRLAYYVPGMTGSDAVYRCVILPGSWNMTIPEHMAAQSTYCRVYNEENDLWAFVLKILYREGWGRFSFE